MSSRLGHVGLDSLQVMTTQELLDDVLICNLESYEHCVLSKKTKVKFDTVVHRTKSLLDLVHMNIWGMTKTVSLDGHRYFVSFIDDSLGIIGYTQ